GAGGAKGARAGGAPAAPRRGLNGPEQAVRIVIHAGGEEQRIRVPARVAVAERQRPQIGDGERVAVVIRELTEKSAVPRLVSEEVAVPVVADEEVAAEWTEVRRSQDEPPGRVERALGSEAPEQVAANVVYVDETLPLAGNLLVPVFSLMGVGDNKPVVDVLDVEWGKAVR